MSRPGILQHLHQQHGHRHAGSSQVGPLFGDDERTHLEPFQLDQLLIPPHAL